MKTLLTLTYVAYILFLVLASDLNQAQMLVAIALATLATSTTYVLIDRKQQPQ